MTGEIYKTHVFFSDFDQGYPHLVDTIFQDGAWWLVPGWLRANAAGERTPERLIRLTGLPHQEVNNPRFRFLLTNSIPKSVLDGKVQDGYVVVNVPVPAGSQPPPGSRLN